MATDLHQLLDDLRAEQAALRALIETAGLDLPTPAEGWDVRDAIAHLAGTDVEAVRAALSPQEFVDRLEVVAADVEGLLTGQLRERRGLSREQLLSQWQDGFDRMVDAFAAVPPQTRIPWYGPPMSPASFATARLMEYWAHGEDVADGLGVRREPTARLRHVCHLGYRTRGFAYANRGLPVPTDPVGVQLTAPDGSTWQFGDLESPDQVRGPALDFCLLVTQRRHRSDTALVATGPGADDWLDVAQCFAGPPGPGRPATT